MNSKLYERRSQRASNINEDARSEFRKDRDRVLYSEEFRRLEGVTQVATGGTARVHNRMTHSLRVEQIAKSIAVHLNNIRKNALTCERYKEIEPPEDIDEDIVAAAGLAHDIGHPPYGHNGEEALQEILVCSKHYNQTPKGRLNRQKEFCKDCYLQDSFEGNAQTFHMLVLLAEKSSNDANISQSDDDGNLVQEGLISVGMDLTRASLRAVLKYPWLRGQCDFGGTDSNRKSLIKWNVYDSDRFAFNWVRQGEASQCPDILAQVMDMADDIAYAVHDIEDFYRAGIIPLQSISDSGSVEFMNLLDYFLSDENKNVIPEILRKTAMVFRDAQQELAEYCGDTDAGLNLRLFITDCSIPKKQDYSDVINLLELLSQFEELVPYDGSADAVKVLSGFRSPLITRFIQSISFDKNRNKIIFSNQKYKLWIEFLKQLTWYYVIDNPHHFAMARGQKRLVQSAFRELYQYASSIWIDHKNDFDGKSLRWKLKDVSLKPARRVPPLLVSYYQKNKAIYDSDIEEKNNEYIESHNMAVKAVVARTVVDYLCTLNDSELLQLSSEAAGTNGNSDFLQTLH